MRSRPWPNPKEAALEGVYTLRTSGDAARLQAALAAGPKRVLIIGAGFIGSEVASVCRELGLAVTVLVSIMIGHNRTRDLTRVAFASPRPHRFKAPGLIAWPQAIVRILQLREFSPRPREIAGIESLSRQPAR